METQSATQEQETVREISSAPAGEDKQESGLGRVFCKMGEGWTCVITRTEGPDAGKVFIKCGEKCTCSIEGETVSKEISLGSNVSGQAFCSCGEGWSCSIFRTEGPDAGSGKGFAECSGKCSCNI